MDEDEEEAEENTQDTADLATVTLGVNSFNADVVVSARAGRGFVLAARLRQLLRWRSRAGAIREPGCQLLPRV